MPLLAGYKTQFPALQDNHLTYLDSASTCQVPSQVIQAISEYLASGHGNPHRGMHTFAEKAEELFARCRLKVANRFNVAPGQMALTKSTTESINLVATGLRDRIKPGQTLLATQMEHHANLLPWQRLCKQTGANLRLVTITPDGELDLELLPQLLADNCALFAFCHSSNLLGSVNPVQELTALARQFGVPTLVDGAQAVAHRNIDLKALGCDYYAFSAHKLYGPTGLGVLYMKNPDSQPPLLLGGGIVNRVTAHDYQLVDDISQFEAGSPNMLAIAGFLAALDYLDTVSPADIWHQEASRVKDLKQVVVEAGYQVISHSESTNILAFASERYHSHDIATVLSQHGVMIRAGHHCAQPCLTAMGLKHCVRASVGLYNDQADVERFAEALQAVPAHLS